MFYIFNFFQKIKDDNAISKRTLVVADKLGNMIGYQSKKTFFNY